ncbi:hypothetical protein G195_000574 [Phytophthora kernoviae 00238/432]|uniref:Uncharacterized protein n=1 Tax=Phytophthora kernoviae 00238/432 TaxID=1284355 RepID=A0A8J4WBY2_9STRA|nr:hypothetical protein G195_000574 [Phytophthora kernoviae 00238/432]
MGLVQEALSALTMAEANLVYAGNQGDLVTAIANNRIVMLTMTGELDQAQSEIERFESLLQQEPEETQQAMKPLVSVYRCEVALARKNWETNGNQYQRTLETLVSKMQIPRVGDRVGLGQNPANPSELIYMGLLSD